jgi:pyroglutamyl-peptidase
MQLIVTGFEKFAEFTYNPSQLAVEGLPEELELANGERAIPLKKLVFKSCCQDTWSSLEEVLRSSAGSQTVVLLTGLASRRDRISLERFALNIRDFRIADNEGHQPQDEPIDQSGPDAIRTSLPLPELCEKLSGKGYLCEVSNHAGTFLCNDIYYRCLLSSRQQGHPAATLFVHVPPLADYHASLERDRAERERAKEPGESAEQSGNRHDEAARSGQSGEPVELPEEHRSEIIRVYSSAILDIARLAFDAVMKVSSVKQV